MTDPKYLFQICQKIAVFRNNAHEVLLCKRKGEADYDGVFSFIGGKMEKTDISFIESMRREKDEEVGENFKIKIYPNLVSLEIFTKKDGNTMALPYYYAEYIEGEIQLNSEEYSEYVWVQIQEFENFRPKIENYTKHLERLLKLKEKMICEEDFVII